MGKTRPAIWRPSQPPNRTCAQHRSHFDKGHYREAILAARLAVETGCGGRGKDVKQRLASAPQEVRDAGDALYNIRHIAVHEGDTRIEQTDEKNALQVMATVLDYLAAAPAT